MISLNSYKLTQLSGNSKFAENDDEHKWIGRLTEGNYCYEEGTLALQLYLWNLVKSATGGGGPKTDQ